MTGYSGTTMLVVRASPTNVIRSHIHEKVHMSICEMDISESMTRMESPDNCA